jgi:hypothetical protein
MLLHGVLVAVQQLLVVGDFLLELFNFRLVSHTTLQQVLLVHPLLEVADLELNF